MKSLTGYTLVKVLTFVFSTSCNKNQYFLDLKSLVQSTPWERQAKLSYRMVFLSVYKLVFYFYDKNNHKNTIHWENCTGHNTRQYIRNYNTREITKRVKNKKHDMIACIDLEIYSKDTCVYCKGYTWFNAQPRTRWFYKFSIR